MAWTQDDIDALKAAIAKGVRRVRIGEKETEYRSLADMRAALDMMQTEVGAGTTRRRQPRFQVADFSE